LAIKSLKKNHNGSFKFAFALNQIKQLGYLDMKSLQVVFSSTQCNYFRVTNIQNLQEYWDKSL